MKYSIDVTLTTASRLSSVDFNNLPFGQTFSDHMFIADYKDGKWQAPRIVPYGPLSMSPANMAIHYGQAIFEGMKAHRTVDGEVVIFRPEKHFNRFNRSAERLAMPEVPRALFMQAIQQLVNIDQEWIPTQEGSALYLRPVLFATDEFLGVRASDSYKLVIMTGPTGPYYPKPVRLWVAEKYVRAFPGGFGFAKAAGNYGGSIKPARLAKERGYDQILWMDGKEFKYLQECGTMNVFAVIGDKVLTPPLGDTILDGVTRDSIIHYLKDNGYDVEVRNISIDELTEAHSNGTLREMFGAGTAAVVSHVIAFGYKDKDYELPALETRKVGPMIKQVIEDMKTGRGEDKYGWLTAVSQMESA